MTLYLPESFRRREWLRGSSDHRTRKLRLRSPDGVGCAASLVSKRGVLVSLGSAIVHAMGPVVEPARKKS